jgi:hypothetical protein
MTEPFYIPAYLVYARRCRRVTGTAASQATSRCGPLTARIYGIGQQTE